MLSAEFLIIVALLYVVGLFALAYFGDRPARQQATPRLQPLIYTLCLAVYCTSWTFYGAVGSAVATGWGFLPIYLGPILVMVLGWPMLMKLAQISQQRNVTSIADFIASRYGRSERVAALVTVIAVCGAVPYIALQLKAVTSAVEIASGSQLGTAGMSLSVALAMAAFAIAFGTRRLDPGEHHRGMLWALALESVVKLGAFVAVGLFALKLAGGTGEVVSAMTKGDRYGELFAPSQLPGGFLTTTALAALAIFCLPRQFYVTAVEFRSPADLRLARWAFPLYLVVFSVMVLPIAVAGMDLLPPGTSGDTFVLMLPALHDQPTLLTLAVLGGFSAATGMVIVACVALATMVSNDLLLPLLMRWRSADRGRDWSTLIISSRRAVIALILLVAWVFVEASDTGQGLASIGLLSFCAAAQFAPALVLGLYWPRASTTGATAGLAAGFYLWAYCLVIPTISGGRWGEGTWLDPYALFYSDIGDPLQHATFWSLAVNLGLLVGISALRRQPLAELIENRSFDLAVTPSQGGRRQSGGIAADELKALAARFVGERNANLAFGRLLEREGDNVGTERGRDLVQFTENLLAGAIGTASARRVLQRALGEGRGGGDAATALSDASLAIRFGRKQLRSTLDHLPQGVSVVDNELRLSGWNQAYVRLFDYPEGLVHVGCPAADLLRFNAERGYLGSDVEGEIQKRLEHLRRGSSYSSERHWPDGRVIETQGNPMPGGGYITTFTDVTRRKQTELALAEAKEELEQRVAQRTEQLSQAVKAMEQAKAEAEQANLTKTRFFAAASHDLLQPLNAARLFTSVLVDRGEAMESEHAALTRRIDTSLSAAEGLLSSLLDVARLERGALVANPQPLSLGELFKSLEQQFSALATQQGLELRIRPTQAWVHSDPQMLLRILQNFVGNALRYTSEGGVLLAERKRQDDVVISVWDTGPGIKEEDRERVFEEFRRGDQPASGNQGLGLGLSISQRMAGMLGHEITLQSKTGRGSVFSLTVASAPEQKLALLEQSKQQPGSSLGGLTVLCIDNESSILEGMQALLSGWGCNALLAGGRSSALMLAARHTPQVVLADYHLNEGSSGLDVIAELRKVLPEDTGFVVISADHGAELKAAVDDLDLPLMRKPLKPAKLRALLQRFLAAQPA
ncbi:MAG: PAS-domain containing protein [Pseudomonadota bacterium]